MFLKKLSVITKKYPYFLLAAPFWVVAIVVLLTFLFALFGGPLHLISSLTYFLILFSPLPAVSLVINSKLSRLPKYATAIVFYIFIWCVNLILIALVPLIIMFAKT